MSQDVSSKISDINCNEVPGPHAPREGSVRSISRSGFHQFAYADWGAEDAIETVFCIHGLTRNRHDFDVLANQLSADSRVICPDLVGRGRSDWLRDPLDYNLLQYNLDFTVLSSHLSAQSFSVVGTSLGGLMGIAMAGLRHSPVKALVVNDIAPQVPNSALWRLSQYIGQDPIFDNVEALELHLRENLAPFGPMTDDNWRRMALTTARPVRTGLRLAYDPKIVHNFLRYWMPLPFRLWRYWDRIECPVLVLRGKESDFLTESLVNQMQRRLPHMDLIEFDGVGHTPTLNAQEQIDPVIQWLARH